MGKYEDIDYFIDEILAKWNPTTLSKLLLKKWHNANERRKKKGEGENKEKPGITNIYEGEEGMVRCENLRFYLEEMRKKNPTRLLVGEAPGIKGCFWTGIPFTDIETLIKNKFFQGRKESLLKSIINLSNEEEVDFKTEKNKRKVESVRLIINSFTKEKKGIKKLFESKFFQERKEKLEDLIIYSCIKEDFKEEETKERIKLVCSIINSCKTENSKITAEEIKKRVKLVYSIIDSCKGDGVKIDNISELTSSMIWKCRNQLCEKGLKLPLFWNIYPFQPWKEVKNERKNRTPEKEELELGIKFLYDLLKCFNIKEIYPVGTQAGQTLPLIGKSLRHPANGGTKEFRRQFNVIYQIETEESDESDDSEE